MVEEVEATVKHRRPKSSEYVFEVFDEVPKVIRQGGGGGNTGPRESRLDRQIQAVKEAFPDGTPGQQVICIAKYGNDGLGASASKATLQLRYTKDEGWFFYSRNLTTTDEEGNVVPMLDENGSKMRGLFVQYKPDGSGVDQGDDDDESEDEDGPLG